MTAMEMTKELAFGAAFGLVTGYAAKKTGSHLVTGGYKKEKIARNELMVHTSTTRCGRGFVRPPARCYFRRPSLGKLVCVCV